MPKTKHIVYYDPSYDVSHPNLWELRGRYKYPSIIGDVGRQAKITLLMHVVPPRSDPHRQRLENEFNVTFHETEEPEPRGLEARRRLAKALLLEFKRLQPTVISNLNGRTITYCYVSAQIAKAIGVRYVMRVGGDDLMTKEHVFARSARSFSGSHHYFELMQQERLAAEWSDAIIVMTERERARMAQITRVPNKISVCYRGVDSAQFAADIPRSGPCRKFLFIGRKSAEKGYDILEDAARALYHEQPELEFTFAGTFDKEVIENRHYIGYVGFNELPDMYRQHDAVIVCSRTEGFPQVLMEAMSLGLPCIVSRHLFELEFEDRRTALFCDPESDDLVQQIKLISNDADFYRSMSQNTLANARNSFSATKLNDRYRSILLGC